MALSSQQYMEQERNALKAKLAEAEIQRRVANLNNEGNLARAEKAEAEAAALREAAQAWLNAADQAAGRAPVSQEDAHRLMYAVMDAAEACRSTLSQPGTGAALLERVKKLEAVAEAVVECRTIDKIVMGDIVTPTVVDMGPFKRLDAALAALAAKNAGSSDQTMAEGDGKEQP